MAITKKNEEGFSRDAIYGGRLILDQPKKGYRFSIDSILLTGFSCHGRHPVKTADLGAGCGVVGLGILAAGWSNNVVAVEVQTDLADIAERNALQNDLASAYRVIRSDIRDDLGLAPSSFDSVVMNPPFWPASDGRLPEKEDRKVACHEILGGIEDWASTAARLLKPGRGRLSVVFRLDSLIIALEIAGLSAARMRLVHPRVDKPAELVLAEARIGKTGRMVVERPLALKDLDGVDTDEAVLLVEGRFSKKLRERPDMREIQE
jgi:tRNA1Val (adenine37-N6)-methyltransferase